MLRERAAQLDRAVVENDQAAVPNEDLDPAYQKIDLSVGYAVHPRLRVYTSIENLFDKDYAAAFGFPSLPFTIRAGAAVTFGGDRRP